MLRLTAVTISRTALTRASASFEVIPVSQCARVGGGPIQRLALPMLRTHPLRYNEAAPYGHRQVAIPSLGTVHLRLSTAGDSMMTRFHEAAAVWSLGKAGENSRSRERIVCPILVGSSIEGFLGGRALHRFVGGDSHLRPLRGHVGCGSDVRQIPPYASSGLAVAHTLLAARRRYRAVVLRSRWPSSRWPMGAARPRSGSDH